MSSEFLEDVDDDEHGTTVLLSMKASGDAFLTVSGCENSNWYHFSPNETGWKNAERIVEAINRWIDHTKSIEYNLTAPRHVGLVLEKEDHCILISDGKEYKLQTSERSGTIQGWTPCKKMWKFYIGKQVEVVGESQDGVLFVTGISA